jgi:arrestin-related trafficking adapter 3/6
MTGASQLPVQSSNRGLIFYTPAVLAADGLLPARFPEPPCRPRQRRPHSIHITRLPASFVPVELKPVAVPAAPRKPSRFRLEIRKLASRDSAKRLLGSVFPSLSSPNASSSAAESSRSSSPAPTRPPSFAAGAADCTSLYWRRSGLHIAGLDDCAMPESGVSRPAGGSPGAAPSGMSVKGGSPVQEKPVCGGSGVACYIILAEPTIFLSGLDHDGTSRESHQPHSSAMLRGVVRLNVSKSVKIKSVTLKFTGRARTEWPEGKSA